MPRQARIADGETAGASSDQDIRKCGKPAVAPIPPFRGVDIVRGAVAKQAAAGHLVPIGALP
jgi:hypothetical protein